MGHRYPALLIIGLLHFNLSRYSGVSMPAVVRKKR